MKETKELSNIGAIKKFFGGVSMDELKRLNTKDREELGELCRKELLV